MSIKIARDDLESIADWCESDVEVRSYSGRGMYGDNCAAIVVSGVSGLIEFVAAVARDVYESPDNLPPHPLNGFLKRIHRISDDSMGLATVYYWQGVTFKGEQ